MNKTILFFVIFLFILVSCSFAGQPGEATGQLPDRVEEFSDYTPVEVLGDLQFHQDLWMEASLNGDSKRAGNYLATVMALLSYDISVASFEVSELAKQALLSRSPEDSESPGVSPQQEAFSRGVAVLNFKEKLFKRIASTRAFSNKYRLVSDYLDVLRRELDHPGVNLAIAGSDEDTKDAGVTTTSED